MNSCKVDLSTLITYLKRLGSIFYDKNINYIEVNGGGGGRGPVDKRP